MKRKILLSLSVILIPLWLVSAESESIQLRVKPERERLYKSKEVIFQIDLAGIESKTKRKSPINLALVLDRSGSMEGSKLEKAKQAACQAIDRLSPEDVFSLVIYDNQIEVLISPQNVKNPEELKKRIHQIHAGGSTALYGGVKEGAEQLRKFSNSHAINRIILLSDGLANVGPSSPGDLAKLGHSLRIEGISVSTVGVGDDYNENLMVALAESSAANYYYVKDAELLPKIFGEELGQIQNIIARNLRVIINIPEGVEPLEIIGCPEIHFENHRAEFTMGEFYGAQKRSLLVRCRVSEGSHNEMRVGNVDLVYHDEAKDHESKQNAVADVKFTDNQEESDRSLNKDVAAESALAENAVTRAKALELQDSGKSSEAAKLLRAQAAGNAVNAPALGNAKLTSEIESLNRAADLLDAKGSFDSSARKSFQYENYKQSKQKQ